MLSEVYLLQHTRFTIEGDVAIDQAVGVYPAVAGLLISATARLSVCGKTIRALQPSIALGVSAR